MPAHAPRHLCPDHGSQALRTSRTVWAVLCWFAVSSVASAEDWVVYYDYVEDGRLTGGRLVIDPNNPQHRADFGLDPVALPRGWAVSTIVDNGPTANRIDLVMLGDGYTQAELGVYDSHVENVLTTFFAEEPFAAYAAYFNVHRVEVISNESGVDEPDLGIFRDTALGMTYNCAGIERLLCINVSAALASAAVAPDSDQVLALANSSRYGGAGYPTQDLGTLAGDNDLAVEIALHEFGHSFADLADEYDYGDGATYAGPEVVQPNVSIYNAAAQVAQQRKWYRWMPLANVDTIEGAHTYEFGIYRPTFDSKMRSLERPFEEINVEQFVISTYKSVSPIDDATPPSAQPLPDGTTFFVTPMQPGEHSLDVQWSIDGGSISGATQLSFTPNYPAMTPGVHQVSVTVVDPTTRVRDEAARALWMTAARQWPVQVLTRDCNANGHPDLDDITAGTSADCNDNSIPDECLAVERDCNANARPDECDLAAGTSADCDVNQTPDECDVALLDCNLNGSPDPCDIAAGSDDCQLNGTPDECDIASGSSPDCDASAIPDECELAGNDCNLNGVPDLCDVAEGTSSDCNTNTTPDECDIPLHNTVYDCNASGVPDNCDIAGFASGDCNGNGIPDECDLEFCYSIWDGFEPDPPFAIGALINGLDYDADGVEWANPSGTSTVGSQGCPAATGRSLKTVSQTPPTTDYVSSEYFRDPDDGAPLQSLTFNARSEATLNPRIDWQLSIRDAANGQSMILIHWASTQSSYSGVTGAQGGNGRGRILVQNPAGSPAFINTGFAIPANTCYTLMVALDNFTGQVRLYINGTLRVTTTRLQAGALHMDYFRLEQKANGQGSGGTNRLALDNFELCQTGGALAPTALVDCDDNGVLDDCDLAAGTSLDCNANQSLDACEVPGDFSGDGQVSAADFAFFAGCFTTVCDTAPCEPALYADPCCARPDSNHDGDVEFADFAVFQAQTNSAP